MKTMEYRVFIQNSSASEKWELPYLSFSFSEELNRDRVAQVSFVRQALQEIADKYGLTIEYILSAAYRELRILDENNVILYAGYVNELNMGGGKNEAGGISIASKGFFTLLKKRVTSVKKVYSSTDAGAIAWGLIDDTQTKTYGDFGITQGTIQTSKNRDRTYRYKNIKSAIEGMSAESTKDGFDFEVDNNKVFNVYYPEKGSTRGNIVLEYGHNIESYTIYKNGIDGMANEAIVLGDGFGDDMLSEVRKSEAIYMQNYFLLQETLSEKDIKTAATLQDKGDKFLDQNKYPRKNITLQVHADDVPPTTYQVGDRVRVVIAQDNVDGFLRIKRRSLQNNGDTHITLEEL